MTHFNHLFHFAVAISLISEHVNDIIRKNGKGRRRPSHLSRSHQTLAHSVSVTYYDDVVNATAENNSTIVVDRVVHPSRPH